jgi:hypothetical protein
VGCRGVQFQVIPCRAAPKAAIDALPDVGGEAPAPRQARLMHRASAAHFFARRFLGHKSQYIQDLDHGDTRADFWKADARHDSSRGEGKRATRLTGQRQEQRRGARSWIALSRVARSTPHLAAELPAGNAAGHPACPASEVSPITILRDAFQDHFVPFFGNLGTRTRSPAESDMCSDESKI